MFDPKVMDQQLQAEGRQPNRYQRRDNIEPTVKPQFEMDYEEAYDDEEEDFEMPAPAPQRPTPPQRQYHNPIHTNDEELLPGLFQSDINSWKKQFGDIWVAEIKGESFVYRALERFEYKEIIGVPNTDPLMREEMICEYCVLYPLGYDFSTMANKKAGIPAVMAELIMEHSGFTRDVQVRKL